MQYGTGERIERGYFRTLGLILMGIAGAEVLLIFEEPGVSVGLYGWLLTGLAYGSRGKRGPIGPEWMVLGLLLLSGLQAIRFTGLSNLLVLGTCVVFLHGSSAYRGLGSGWARWMEGGLTFLRPLGVIETYLSRQTKGAEGEGSGMGRFRYWLRVGMPAAILLLVFGWLLSVGNAVLGNWSLGMLSWLERLLTYIEIPSIERIIAWTFFGGVALVVTCPARASGLSGMLLGEWRNFGRNDLKIRRYQWLAILLSMNVLFLISSVTDVVYLWMSRELPEGVTHSVYLHQGVYVLIFTTILSALILGTLTQHDGAIKEGRLIRGLSLGWMVQNLMLISGVFLRLKIYVDAYGHTPKRVYVMLFLVLVMGGFALLAWAVFRLKSFKWLAGANLLLVFGYFSVLQFADIPGFVAGMNTDLYRKGQIEYPESQYFRQIGTHAFPCLIAIYNQPQTEADRQQALAELMGIEEVRDRYEKRWQSFQSRDYRNWRHWEEFMEGQGILLEEQP